MAHGDRAGATVEPEQPCGGHRRRHHRLVPPDADALSSSTLQSAKRMVEVCSLRTKEVVVARYRRFSMSDIGDDTAPLDLAARNHAIVAAYRAGETMTSVAERHGLSAERVRQLVRRAEGAPPKRSRRSAASTSGGEMVRLRIGNLAKAVLVIGPGVPGSEGRAQRVRLQRRRRVCRGGIAGERIRILLRRRGVRAVIAVDDVGRGHVARSAAPGRAQPVRVGQSR